MAYKNNKTGNRRRYKSRYHSPHNYKTKRTGSGNRTPILIGIATFLILASLVLVFTFGDRIYTFLDNTFHPAALPLPQSETMGVVLATEPEPEPPTESPTEPEPAPTEAETLPVEQGDEFNRLLTAAGLKADQLNGTQMIFVESAGTSAKVYCYEKDTSGKWAPKYDVLPGFVGTGGVSANVGPADDTTPTGTFRFEFAFGNNPNPGTAFEYSAVTIYSQWVTDPASVNYNRMIEAGSTVADYASCQQLCEYTKSYPYALVFDYNRNPVDPARGCARFLHAANEPTYGGVGIAQSALEVILQWLTPDANPTISIF
ncbi:hypothetical protein [Ruminococcus sp.]|uniref:hypothetical protein n=1 Tax=Ruminococcus sp. TaxID=41978 RepID=UPI00388E1B32